MAKENRKPHSFGRRKDLGHRITSGGRAGALGTTLPNAPIVLGPNQPPQFYRGGAGIARFRGTPQPSRYAPEDWVGSTTSLFSRPGVGLSRLPDGETLRDAIARAPEAFLGPDHVARYGADPALLVKLLDTGERLVVHFHPDRDFAARYLGSRYGKTEAWIILGARPESCVCLGFKADTDPGCGRVTWAWASMSR